MFCEPIYFDCRRVDVRSPESVTEALISATRQQGQRVVADVAVAVLSSVSDKFGTDVDLKMTLVGDLIAGLKLKTMPGGTPLARTLNAFEKALAARQTSPPAIILDEAGKLTSWTSAYADALDTLLSFLIAITQQQNLTQVLLINSDYACINWREQRKHTRLSCPSRY